MIECAECEQVVYAGHAPNCSRRCHAIDDVDGITQCDKRSNHGGPHGVYGPDDDDGIVRTWPASIDDVDADGVPIYVGSEPCS